MKYRIVYLPVISKIREIQDDSNSIRKKHQEFTNFILDSDGFTEVQNEHWDPSNVNKREWVVEKILLN